MKCSTAPPEAESSAAVTRRELDEAIDLVLERMEKLPRDVAKVVMAALKGPKEDESEEDEDEESEEVEEDEDSSGMSEKAKGKRRARN